MVDVHDKYQHHKFIQTSLTHYSWYILGNPSSDHSCHSMKFYGRLRSHQWLVRCSFRLFPFVHEVKEVNSIMPPLVAGSFLEENCHSWEHEELEAWYFNNLVHQFASRLRYPYYTKRRCLWRYLAVSGLGLL